MAMWPHYVTLLVITSNNILLNPPIALAYYLFLPDCIFNISNFIYLLLEIGFFSVHCWNALARYYIIEKRINLSFYSPNISFAGMQSFLI